jgi:hypothetical protein
MTIALTHAKCAYCDNPDSLLDLTSGDVVITELGPMHTSCAFQGGYDHEDAEPADPDNAHDVAVDARLGI